MGESIQTSRFTIDRAAYMRAMYTYNLWGQFWRLALLMAVLITLGGFLIGPPVALGGAIVAVVALPSILLARYRISRQNIYGSASRQVFDDPRTMIPNALGIQTITDGGVEGKVPWTHIVRAVQRGGFTLLFSGRIVHLVVPDSSFASSADHESFVNLLEQQSFPKVMAKHRPISG